MNQKVIFVLLPVPIYSDVETLQYQEHSAVSAVRAIHNKINEEKRNEKRRRKGEQVLVFREISGKK